ncbi:MAG: carboxypeptidase-like regulatory domain-containing protein [Bacteroidales bacterium]|nr:carboxypeptidase-like regulatory domain-containing protein [Bacteroidales bacterium]
MKPGLKHLITACLLFVSLVCGAQTTKVRGRVTDEAGEGIPFAGVYFKGTTVGITADIDGYYNLETKDLTRYVLVAQLLGYDPMEVFVQPGKFNEVDFTLRLTDNRLSGAKVKADNKKARELLANIQAHRSTNDPDNHPEYICEIYNKMELDLTHPAEQLDGKRFKKEFGFVFDYIDTSSVSGVPYLPVMISETVAERKHRSDPEFNTETVLANRISGLNPDGNNMLSQFTGSLHLRINFYRPFINAFDVQFPSPIQENGLLYYNYYIIDTLKVDGRKTLLVRYHPKQLVSTPAFDGEMRIDCEDYALRSIHANMKNTTNVNWLRDLVFDSEYERQPDSTWFYKSDRLYVDLSLSLQDSSKMLSFIGKKDMRYSKVRFELKEKLRSGVGMVKVEEDASKKDEAYWASARPEALSEKEQEIYDMVDKIQTVPLYKSLYEIVYTAINGYYEVGKIGFGPYFKLLSFNALEGLRPQFGLRTSKSFSLTDRFTVYGAYGTRDKTLKGGATWEHLFGRIPERKLTLSAKYDVHQMGSAAENSIGEGNILATIFGGSYNNKLCMMSSFAGSYQHEFSMRVNGEIGFDFKRYYPNEAPWLREMKQVQMYAPDSTKIHSVAANEMYVALRFSKDETVNRGLFKKQYVYSEYPSMTFSLAGSVSGLRPGDYSYLRPEFTLRWSPRVPPFGTSKIYVNAGKIIGTVPYPMLHMHEGNSTYLLNRFSFACMDFMEFASDQWLTVFWNHCFNGFFFGKIPIIRKLGWREEVSVRAAWGSLSPKNNGNLAKVDAADMQAPMLFPNGTSSLGRDPYVEFGAGISNILKFIRVDCYWRASYRDQRIIVVEDPGVRPVIDPKTGQIIDDPTFSQKVLSRLKTPNFAVKIGAEFKF